MFKAVKDGDLGTVAALLKDDSALLQITDKDGNTPLHWAAWKGHAPIVEALLDAGADIGAHSENGHWGTTPLHAAAHGNQRAAAEVLIRRGADVNAARAVGTGTPLAETKIHNAPAVARLLREAGAVE
ncbi:hypothetical protein BH11ARM2_BH11ARM2_34470 [soil metagenome]